MKKILVFVFSAFCSMLSAQTLPASSVKAIYREFDGVYEKISVLNTQLNQQRQQISSQSVRISGLSSELQSVKSENRMLKAELADLKEKLCRQEAEFRAMLNKAVNDLASTTEKALKEVQQSVPESSAGAEYDVYVVEPGATLSAIAKAVNCTVSELKKINNLKKSTIYVGQKLKIPVK